LFISGFLISKSSNHTFSGFLSFVIIPFLIALLIFVIECMWQNNNLLSDHVYRISFDILDRSSNDGEEYFMSKHDIYKLNDSMNKLASDLKQAVLD